MRQNVLLIQLHVFLIATVSPTIQFLTMFLTLYYGMPCPTVAFTIFTSIIVIAPVMPNSGYLSVCHKKTASKALSLLNLYLSFPPTPIIKSLQCLWL